MADITYIPIRQLYPHPDNPRKELGDLSELAASIKENGVYQNLTVIPGHYLNSREYIAKCVDEGGDAAAAAAAWTPKAVWSSEDYTIIIGHRRAAAAQQAGLYELPCAIVEMDEREQMQTMMIENMQRSDLTVYEQAQGFQMMMDFGQTVEQISDKSGVLPVHYPAAHQAAGTEPRQLQESRKARCHPVRFRPAGQNRGLGSPKPGIGNPRYAKLQPGHAGCAGAAKMAAPKGRMG